MQGPKGIPQLIVRNYIYVKHTGELTKTSYWKCRYYDRGQCKARCKTGDAKVVLTGTHSHLPDYDKLHNRLIVNQHLVTIQMNQSVFLMRARK